MPVVTLGTLCAVLMVNHAVRVTILCVAPLTAVQVEHIAVGVSIHRRANKESFEPFQGQ